MAVRLLLAAIFILSFTGTFSGADESLPVTHVAFLYDGPMGHEYIDRSLIKR